MSSAPERFRQVRDAFERVIGEPPERRPDLLDAVASHDPAIVRHVLALLDAHDFESSPLDASLPVRVLRDGGFELDADDWIGRRIGPYRLERELGRGGMGTVYEAKRDGADFEQRVAIKLIRAGADSESIVRRFRRERQILAALHHPNIATLMDGAVMPDGRPYLVMELVDGEPIDRYANARRLTVRQRITLFLGVCDAVDHAHRNLVVHRDLKPSNVLVTPDGVPKLLDFGIAKLVRPDEDADLLTLTDSQLRFFTPEYASPEQLRDAPITTRSDVYSLGVILYQLLSGERPFGDAGRGVGDLERLLTMEPPRPSTVATDRAARDRRESDAATLQRRLAGELDNIVLMALRKEPERRYSSVEQFAEDLRRYLDGRTVIAQTDTAGYRIRKFLGRHRAGVAAATLILVATIGGVTATVWQATLARAAARRAQAERAKAEQVTAFLSSVLGSANPAWTTKGTRVGPNTTVIEALHNASLNLGSLAGQPEVEAAVRRTLGYTYTLLGVPDSGEPHLRRAVELQRRLSQKPNVDLATSVGYLAVARHQQGHYPEAQQLAREGVALLRAAGDTSTLDMANALNDLAVFERSAGNLAASDTASASSIAAYRKALGPNSPGLANGLTSRSVILADRGDLEGAERMLREVFAIYEHDPQREFSERAVLLFNLAAIRMWRGDYAEADSLAQASFDAFMRTVGEKNPNTAMALTRLAYSHHLQGHDTLAMREIARARAMLVADGMAPNHPELARVSTIEGQVLTSLGQPAVADTMLRHALAIRMAVYKATDMRRPESMIALGVTLAAEGKAAEADSLLRLGESEMARLLGANDPRAQWAARERAAALSRLSARRSPCSTNAPGQPSCRGRSSAPPG